MKAWTRHNLMLLSGALLMGGLLGGCGGGGTGLGGLPQTSSVVIHWPGTRSLADQAASIDVWLVDRNERVVGERKTISPSRPVARYDGLNVGETLRVQGEAFDQSGGKVGEGVSHWLTVRSGVNEGSLVLSQVGASLLLDVSFDDSNNGGSDDDVNGDDNGSDDDVNGSDDDVNGDDNGSDDDVNGSDDDVNGDDNGSDDDVNGSDDDVNGDDNGSDDDVNGDDNGATGDNGSGDGGSGGGDSSGSLTYTGSVKSILDSRCTACHGPGGPMSHRPLTTYAEVKVLVDNGKLASALNGNMKGYAGTDRQTLLDWIAQGAPG